jgi:putative pyruvate formate lyase activating enzyme
VFAAKEDLRLPLVYNTGGYDSRTALRLLDGVVDIYMPDMKYANPRVAQKYSKALDYPGFNRKAVEEMHRQVGDLQVDEHGIARRGLLVRHLILPNRLAGTREIIHFLAEKISHNVYLNLMDQYRPCYNARLFPPINRSINRREYEEAIQLAHAAGLHRLDHDKQAAYF